MNRWTSTQDKILIRGAQNGLTAREISESLHGRAIIAVRRRAAKLGLVLSKQEAKAND